MKRSIRDESSPQERPLKDHHVRLLFHTVDGVIPFMTPLLLRNYFPPDGELMQKNLLLGMTVKDTCIVPMYPKQPAASTVERKKTRVIDASKPCGYGFKPTPMDGFLAGYHTVTVPSFDLCQDALDLKKTTSCSNKQVMVWTSNGRIALSPDTYFEASTSFQSSAVASVSLYDVALDDDSKKRKQLALQRTQTWFDQYVQKHNDNAHQNRNKIWAPVFVLKKDDDKHPKDTSSPVTHIQQHQDSLSGIAIVGWHHISTRSDRIHRLQTLLKETDAIIQNNDLTVAVLTTLSTTQMLDAARLGVNVIGTALPTLWAKSKRAFACKIKGWVAATASNQSNKRPKHIEQKKDDKIEEDMAGLDEDGCMDLNNTDWVRDRRPLVPGCECVACHNNKHSRAYIHHLVLAKEVLAEILLFGHNLHHCLILCQEMSKAIQEDNEKEFFAFMEAQLQNIQ